MIAKVDTTDYARELDQRAVACLRRRSAIDLELGQVLLALFGGSGLLKLNYSKQSDYCREALGLPARTVRQFTRLAKGLRRRRILRQAVASGLVSMRKALIVMERATGVAEEGWTRAAMRRTERELGEKVRDEGGRPPEEPFDVESVMLRMSEKQQDRLDAAIRDAFVVLGGVRPKWMALDAIASEWASGHGVWWPAEGGGRLEVAVDPLPPAEPSRPRAFHVSELDRMARELAAERLAFDLRFGPLLRKLKRHRVWKVLDYASFEEYARERLGVSIRTVRQRIWLERRMDDLPELREALANGTLTYTKALFVAKDAAPG